MSFKVFSDSTSTISSSSSSSFGYPTTSTAGRSILGKENIDPRGASSSSSKLKVPMKPKKMIKVDNGICTGTLRTKVIPDLPPLQPTSSKIFIKSNTSNKSSITILKRSKIITTTILDRRSASDSGYSNGSNCSSTTTTPTTPSSTSSPGQGTDGSGLEGETIKMLNDIIVESSRESTTSIATITAVDQTIIIGRDDLTYTNRLARGLTESPLAEITQAFTSLSTDAFTHSPTLSRSSQRAALVPNSTLSLPSTSATAIARSRNRNPYGSPTRSPKSTAMKRVVSKPYWKLTPLPFTPKIDDSRLGEELTMVVENRSGGLRF